MARDAWSTSFRLDPPAELSPDRPLVPPGVPCLRLPAGWMAARPAAASMLVLVLVVVAAAAMAAAGPPGLRGALAAAVLGAVFGARWLWTAGGVAVVVSWAAGRIAAGGLRVRLHGRSTLCPGGGAVARSRPGGAAPCRRFRVCGDGLRGASRPRGPPRPGGFCCVRSGPRSRPGLRPREPASLWRSAGPRLSLGWARRRGRLGVAGAGGPAGDPGRRFFPWRLWFDPGPPQALWPCRWSCWSWPLPASPGTRIRRAPRGRRGSSS